MIYLIRYWKPLLLLALVLGLFGAGYAMKARIDAREAELAQAKQEAAEAKSLLALERAQAKVTERVVTKYVDRVKVVEGRTRTIIKEVPVYVPADSPLLPGGYRVLHDAAAQGVLPDPARVADAAPVPAQDAASTAVENYGICHGYVEQIIGLQDWIRGQQAVAK